MLTTVVLPKHFAHAKFESFNRSVNGWGFKVYSSFSSIYTSIMLLHPNTISSYI